MKKRSLLITVLSLLLIACLSVFVACGGDNGNSGDSGNSGNSASVTDSSTGDSSTTVDEGYIITGVSMPEYYSSYLTTVEDEEAIFTTVEDNYKVGDDNAMSVRPTVQGISNATGTPNSDIQDIAFVVTVAKWNGEDFIVMDNPGTDVDVDSETATVDFVEEAVGNLYKISVYPEGLSENQLNKLENYTVEVVFEIVDGYNASSVIEFSLVDNSTVVSEKDILIRGVYTTRGEEWIEMRRQAGITVDSSTVNGVVLHADIAIDNTNIPKEFFYNEGDADLNKSDADYERTKGALRDWSGIFVRYNQGKKFDIYGNYFSINTSKLPLMTRDGSDIVNEGDVVNSHSTLLYVQGSTLNEDETLECSDQITTLENLNVLGNLKLSDTFETGGINFVKFNRQSALVDNVVARQWYITVFNEFGEAEEHKTLINDCQFYDNYSFFLYSYGGYIDVKNSKMISCGGPVVMCDNCEYGTETNPDGFIPTFNVDEASVLESWVAGTETWFIQNSATAVVSAIVSLDALFNYQGGVTYVKTENEISKVNLIVVMKSGDVEGMSFDKIHGLANVGTLKFNMDNPIPTAFAGQSVLFQGASQEAFVAMNYMEDGTPYLADAMGLATGNPAPADNTHLAFSGDHLGMYVGAAFAGGAPDGYMGVILGGYRAM